jgi:VIT1/CCC1 family predicted Fe2+/Mn2+ transporter
MSDEHAFLLQRVQPAMVGLIDGSLSTLAPIFAVVLASHDTRYAFIAGLATSIGAAISMGFSEALSDTGELTGRGSPWSRGLITGGGTFLGGILHTLPFLISQYHVALFFAIAVVGFELLTLAYLRWKFFQDTFIRALAIVTFAGVIIAGISAGLGSLLGNPVTG